MSSSTQKSKINSEKKKNTFQVTHTLNFKNHKFQLYAAKNFPNSQLLRSYRILLTVNLALGFMSARSLYKRRFIRTVLWGVPTFYLSRLTRSIAMHCAHLVTKIELKDNGTHVEITKLNGSRKTIDIKDLRRGTEEEFKGAMMFYGMTGQAVYPISIENKNYLLDKNGEIEDQDVFAAVCNGYYIDLSEIVNEKGETNIIDV